MTADGEDWSSTTEICVQVRISARAQDQLKILKLCNIVNLTYQV